MDTAELSEEGPACGRLWKCVWTMLMVLPVTWPTIGSHTSPAEGTLGTAVLCEP